MIETLFGSITDPMIVMLLFGVRDSMVPCSRVASYRPIREVSDVTDRASVLMAHHLVAAVDVSTRTMSAGRERDPP